MRSSRRQGTPGNETNHPRQYALSTVCLYNMQKKEEAQASTARTFSDRGRTIRPLYSLSGTPDSRQHGTPNLPSPLLDENKDDFFEALLSKSQKIVSMNYELGQKLSENERVIGDLEQDIEILRKRLSKEGSASRQVSDLKKKIYALAEQNSSLADDLRILKDGLARREQYLTILKREFSRRLSPRELQREKEKESAELRKKMGMMQSDISLLQADIEEKNRHINFLKRQLVSRQLTLFREEEQKMNAEIKELRSLLDAREKKLAEYGE